MRPPRPDIAAPPLPPGIEWVGEPVASIDRLLAERPVLIHFFDFAQLNSVRTLPYLRAWRERYADAGLAVLGIHSPRFPFSREARVVEGALHRLGVDWPVALDSQMAVWRAYEPRGWPSVFLWGKGGALRWHHLGEGEYAATEGAIQAALEESSVDAEWPPPVEPVRASDSPGAGVVAPTPELFPGGSIEEPWSVSPTETSLIFEFEAAGAYAATDGEGEIAVRLDGRDAGDVRVQQPGLQELVAEERHGGHELELTPSAGVRIYSLQFAAGPP